MPTTLIHVPFAKGQNEGVDPKLMPQGVLRRAVNVRLRADGRIGCRHGYSNAGVDVLGGGSVAPHDVLAFGEQQLILAGGDRSLVRVETGASWKALDDGKAAARSLRVVSDVEAIAAPPLQNQCQAADVAVTSNGWAAMVWTTPVSSSTYASAMVVRVSDGVVLCTERLAVVKSAEAVRVVAVGTSVYVLLIDNTSGDLEVFSLDTASEGAFTDRGQLIDAADISSSYTFDARANGSAEFVVAWRRTASGISWENFTASTLATVGSRQTATANGKLSVAAVNGAVVAIANITSTGTVECRTWNESTQALIGLATVDSNTDNTGQPWVELNAAGSSAMVTWGATVTGTNATHPAWRYRTVNTATLALGTLTTTAGGRPASGSFFLPSGETGLWLVDDDTVERGYVCTRFGVSRTAEPEALLAKPYAATSALMTGRRGKVIEIATGEYVWCPLVVPETADTTASPLDCGPVLYRFKCEQATRAASARLGGGLYLAGGLVSTFDGARYYEQDFCWTPIFDELTAQTGSGALTSSCIYTYSAVLEFVTSQRERVFSAVATPRNVTMGVGNNQVRMEFHAPFLRKLDAAMASTNVNLIVYRSKADGTVLREVARLKWANGLAVISYTDTADDCDLDGAPVIYTQGSRGALTGLLQNDAPNACDYMAVGRDRVVVGRKDGVVQWSKRLFMGETVAWSNQSGFFSRVPGLTALASLDERWILFTADGIWEVTGEGPDDTGQGEFSSPRRLPSEGGCTNALSLVEVSGGLFYQQSDGRLFLLPRGGGSPVWAGQPVRDTLEAFPVVTSAVYVRLDNAVYFTCNNSGGTEGRIIVHDLRTGDWYVDDLDGSPVVLAGAAWSGVHVVAGSSFVREQTTGYADVAAAIAMLLETGSLFPFGVNAWGLIHDLVLLGRFESACTVEARYSVDDGETYEALTTHALSGYDAQEPVRIAWSLPRLRADRVVFEWTITATGSPGAAFSPTAFTLEVEPAEGPPRLPADVRA